MERQETTDLLGKFLEAIGPIIDMLDLESKKVLRKLQDLVDTPGDPGRILEAKRAWDTEFLTGIFSKTLTGHLRTTRIQAGGATDRIASHWEGDAADAFASYMHDRIQRALVELEKYFAEVGKTLDDLKEARDTFWETLAAALLLTLAVGGAGAFISGVISGGTLAAATAAAAVSAFIAAVGGVIFAAVRRDMKFNEAVTELGEIELHGFENDLWPRPVTSWRDASVKDGDDSDWSPR